MSAVIALDLGTSRCKAAVIDEKGEILSKEIKEYDILFPREGYAEQDPEEVWKVVKEVIKSAVKKIENQDQINGIGFSVQGEAVMPIDKNGTALDNAILGMDTRCGRENQFLRNKFTEEALYRKTGMPIHTVNTLPKLLWLKNNKRDVFEKAWKFVLYEDFLTMKMCGRPVLDASLASRTQMYNLKKEEWSEKILKKVEIPKEKLGEVVEPGQVMGEMKGKMADELGLTTPLYLVAGGHDQACAALGAGVINNFAAMDSVGTAEVVEVASDSLKLDSSLRKAKISTYKHVVPGMYLTMTLNHTAGLLVKWCIDKFFKQEVKEAQEKGKDKYEYIINKLTIDCPSYNFLVPHFNGSGTPWVDERDLGAMLGLNLQDDKYTILKAILEGLVYELKVNLNILEDCNYEIRKLKTVGGGAKSEKWMKIRASILNKDLISTEDKDVALMGSYILAASGINIFDTVESGTGFVLDKSSSQVFKPVPDLTNNYKELTEIYEKIYPNIEEINKGIYAIKNEQQKIYSSK